MAKMRGPAMSGFVGKVGNLVGRKSATGYVVSAYQPSVYNPSTSKQVGVRTAFSMLAEVGKLFGKENLGSLPSMVRQRGGSYLSQFIRLNFPAVTYEPVAGLYPIPSVIRYADLRLSVGSLPVPTLTGWDLNFVDGLLQSVRVSVLTDGLDPIAPEGRIRVVLVLEDERPHVFGLDVENNSQAEFDLSNPRGGQSEFIGMIAHVFAYSYGQPLGSDAAHYGQLDGSNQSNATIEKPASIRTGNLGLSFSDSVYLGQFLLTAPQP